MNLRHIIDHQLERIHQHKLIDFNQRQSQSSQTIAILVGKRLQKEVQLVLCRLYARQAQISQIAFGVRAEQLFKFNDRPLSDFIVHVAEPLEGRLGGERI